MSLTAHAQVRAQQRGVPPLVVELLERYGREIYDHSGAIVLHFDKKAVRQLERELGHVPVRRLSEYLHCYAIVSTSGEVITVGKRFKRINR